jgi:hypothetical protein
MLKIRESYICKASMQSNMKQDNSQNEETITPLTVL